MPVYQVTIQKQLNLEFWVNVYYVNTPDQAAGRVAAEAIIDAERAVHMANVSFVNYRIRPWNPGPLEGTVYPIGLVGEVPTASFMPLFNVLRVDMAVSIGRPSRKYLRLPLGMSVASNGQLTPVALADYTNLYALPLNAITALVDVDGQPIEQVQVQPTVGMHQLRRGSKRRTTPVI